MNDQTKQMRVSNFLFLEMCAAFTEGDEQTAAYYAEGYDFYESILERPSFPIQFEEDGAGYPMAA